MEEGFQKAQTDNLPKITEEMIMQFFTANPHFFSAEIRGVKAQRSTRESYGDNAVGYVQVKRDGSVCIVKARITPEHRVKSKAYTVTLVCNEMDENIISILCEGCAASAGGCKHIIAFLFWVHRKCSIPSPTEVECYWKRSKLASIGSTEKILYASNLGKKVVKALPPKNPSIFEEGMLIINEKNIQNLQLCNFFSEFSDSEKISIHHLMMEFSLQEIGTKADEFLDYIKNKVTADICSKVAQLSVGQNKNPLWHEMRYARITASKVYEASRCTTVNGSLVESILGAKFRPTEAIKRGSQLEDEVIKKIQKKHNIKIKPSGLVLNPEYPIFGASPDGVATDFIVEVKCPTSENTMKKYFVNNIPTAKHHAQMQLQMLFANKSKGLFCIAHPDFESSGDITEIWVELDKEYCQNLMHRALYFWSEAIFPKVYKSCLAK